MSSSRAKIGDVFPFDAPDAWWKEYGQCAPAPPAVDWAHSAARGVIAYLQFRDLEIHDVLSAYGVSSHVRLAGNHEKTRAEIVQAIAGIIRETLKAEG